MKKIAVIILAISVCACSQYASNADKQYLNSRNGTALVVPSPLTSLQISHFYDLPKQDNHTAVSIAPPDEPAIAR